MAQGWEEIDHTADWALRVWADNLPGLFETAARGMTALIGGEAPPNSPEFERRVELSAPDAETLLVDWLTEILRLVEEDNAVVTHTAVSRADGLYLMGTFGGRLGGQFSKHIKAVTYHNLAIRETPSGLETTLVFDV